jgi:hypothetical protein
VTPSEHVAEYAVRVIAAAATAVIATGAVFLGLSLIPMDLWGDSRAAYYASVTLQCLATGFVFVFAGTVVLPRGWRVGGALVFVLLGIGLRICLMQSYSSDPGPRPLWPVLVETAGGAMAFAVRYMRRTANES